MDTEERGSLSLASRTSVVHDGYNQSTNENDIALIRLPLPVNFTCKCSKILIKEEQYRGYIPFRSVLLILFRFMFVCPVTF